MNIDKIMKMTKEEKERLEETLRNEEIKIDKNTYTPYKEIDGVKYNMEII